MKRYGQIFLGISLAALLAWVLPWLYNLITLKPYSTPFTLYSCTVHDFTSLDRSEGKGFQFIDTKGNIHGDEAQPTFYASVLASRGALPDTLEGRRVSLEEIERNAVFVTSEPKDLNRTLPPVYLLMESVPERLELKDPEDAMVSRKESIDIMEMATNTVRVEKTRLFNQALRAEGFVYPARFFAGKPSHRKEYDEGYLVTDAEDKVFHVKQINDTVHVRRFPQANGLGVHWMFITEFENRATLGYLAGADNHLYMLRPSGEVVKTEVAFNPRKEDLMVVGDLFYYTVKTATEKGERFWALRSNDFSLVDTLERPYPQEWSFPGLRFTSANDGWVKPRF